MLPWHLIDRARTPAGTGEMTLYRRGDEFSIRIDYAELMNSRQHGSEEAMARLACAGLGGRPDVRVLIGGLGMGFTLAATLAALGPDAAVDVAELMEAVVRWNRAELGACAGRPLDDPRTTVHEGDVRNVVTGATRAYDAILLDVDNGPDGLAQPSNAWLYHSGGLAALRGALRAGGVLCIWSAQPDDRFTRRLRDARFDVRTHTVRARANGKGARHTIWVATAPS